MRLIIPFSEICNHDVPIVGGKNASLGEIYNKLGKRGVRVPNGFALTADAYDLFIKENRLDGVIRSILKDLNTHDIRNLRERGKKVRAAVSKAKVPKALADETLK
ncbi:MAG: PEP/pyruvate-binding domain-containing protein, partial [Candidatus Aenigmatarchaeota archaeon]